MSIITLTTDFGNDDPFDGIMKGVILSICPNANIVDLTHNISPQDIYQANFLLSNCYQYFPSGTIHVCVVDPGVGSLRKPILIKTKIYFFIGPDNGIFTSIIEKEEVINSIELTNKKYWLPNVSQTFHGRDIFAPIAAHLANGENISNLGNQIKKEDLVRLLIQKSVKNKDGITGIVQYIDHFGNLITNIPNADIPSKITGKVKAFNFDGLVSNFADSKDRKLTAIKGSSGYIEIFIYKGNASKLTSVNVGDKVDVKY